MKKKRMTCSEFFTLSWKKTAIALMIWIGSVFFHNMIYAFFRGIFKIELDEPVFFCIAVIIIPGYFLISIVYSLIKRKGRLK